MRTSAAPSAQELRQRTVASERPSGVQDVVHRAEPAVHASSSSADGSSADLERSPGSRGLGDNSGRRRRPGLRGIGRRLNRGPTTKMQEPFRMATTVELGTGDRPRSRLSATRSMPSLDLLFAQKRTRSMSRCTVKRSREGCRRIVLSRNRNAPAGTESRQNRRKRAETLSNERSFSRDQRSEPPDSGSGFEPIGAIEPERTFWFHALRELGA